MRRVGGRRPEELRPLLFTPNFLDSADGSALVSWGRTRVLCAAAVLDQAPAFRQAVGGGWVTGEYNMLPQSTRPRQERERRGGLSGRTQEIQRLIGRSLRAVVDLKALGPITVVLDCDVLQADGGTRTAAISGALVALCLALEGRRRQEQFAALPVIQAVAAVSVGLVAGQLFLDLDYEEDSQAMVDANFVATGKGDLVEVQLTGEGGPFPATRLPQMLELAMTGIRRIVKLQEEALAPWLPLPW
jgi:ribonuclease PH